MSTPESTKFSYIRTFREIVPSDEDDSLAKFLAAATDLLDRHGQLERNGPNRSLVYAADSLRITLYERRARAGQEVNGLLHKVYAYMEASKHVTTRRIRKTPGGGLETKRISRVNPLPGALHDAQSLYVPDPDGMFVRADAIVDCTKDDYRDIVGTELALRVTPGPAASVLSLQSDLVHDAAMRPAAASKLPRAVDTEDPLAIAFMHARFESDSERDEFVDALTPYLPVHSIGIGPVSTRLTTINV